MSGGGFTGLFQLVLGLVLGLAGAVVVIYVLAWALAVPAWTLVHLILRPLAWVYARIPERAVLTIGTAIWGLIGGAFCVAFYGLAILIAVGGL